MQLGGFVEESRANIGPAKLVAVADDVATIEYFASIEERHRRDVPTRLLRPFQVFPQHRCYVKRDDRWWMGRVKNVPDPNAGAETYFVQFPNGDFEEVAEERLHIRWNKPIEDPLETLIHNGHETPFFHQRRWAFVDSLVKQRVASRGLTGVISSVIDLHPHQVDVARRVLSDSVQRYLLADEVGLGKTIESGMIVRQYLIDHPTGTVLILVPDALRAQWQTELEQKFRLLSDFCGADVKVLAASELDQAEACEFLVIDEAHHVAPWAYGDDSRRALYARVAELAHAADRLLLLSATPVRQSEQAFLAMLHLLDPAIYRLGDVEAFKERVRLRDEIGLALAGFGEDLADDPTATAFLIETSLDTFVELFPDDERLGDLCSVTRALLPDPDAEEVVEDVSRELQESIRGVRWHIGETYRLHQRMLRYRREGAVGEKVRGRRFGGEIRIPNADVQEIEMHLNLWRDRISLAVIREEIRDQVSSYRRLVGEVFEAARSDLSILRAAVDRRLRNGGTNAGDSAQSSMHLPLVDGEEERLYVLARVLSRESQNQRLNAFFAWLAEHAPLRTMDPPEKMILFTSFTEVASHIGDRLGKAYSQSNFALFHMGIDESERREGLERFRNEERCALLVCDSLGEEGHNFQMANLVIHFDLPWDPNRIEQRLGRVDRFASSSGDPVPSLTLVPVEDPESDQPSVERAWLSLLREQYRVFDRSVSALQYLIDEERDALLEHVTEEGAAGLWAYGDLIGERIKEETQRIDREGQLNAVGSKSYGEAVDIFDAIYDCEAEGIERPLHEWFDEALKFPSTLRPGKMARDKIITYRLDTRAKVLVPVDRYATQFGPYLDKENSFSRKAAMRSLDTGLLRIGHPLIDEMDEYIRWDDRGKAFAMWRTDPSFLGSAPLLAMRFDYLIEADVGPAQAVAAEYRVAQDALRRRADALFPPLFTTVWVDEEGKALVDEDLIERLEARYEDPDSRFEDTNLSVMRLDALHKVIPEYSWAPFCRRLRDAADQRMRDVTGLDRRIEHARRDARIALNAELERLRLRSSLDGGWSDVGESDIKRDEALADALLRGISRPAIRLDATGLVVLHCESPPR